MASQKEQGCQGGESPSSAVSPRAALNKLRSTATLPSELFTPKQPAKLALASLFFMLSLSVQFTTTFPDPNKPLDCISTDQLKVASRLVVATVQVQSIGIGFGLRN